MPFANDGCIAITMEALDASPVVQRTSPVAWSRAAIEAGWTVT